jgi:hypothetical protein
LSCFTPCEVFSGCFDVVAGLAEHLEASEAAVEPFCVEVPALKPNVWNNDGLHVVQFLGSIGSGGGTISTGIEASGDAGSAGGNVSPRPAIRRPAERIFDKSLSVCADLFFTIVLISLL